MTFTMTGNGQFLGANQGLLLAFLKHPGERPPLQTFGPDFKPTTIEDPSIQDVSGALTAQTMMNVPGTFGIYTPQPVLQIATGATARSAGQFAYSLSGIDANEVYASTGRLLARLAEYPGFANPPYPDMNLNTPNLEIDILRDRAAALGVSASRIETLL